MGEKKNRKTHTIGVRVDPELYSMLVKVAESRGESVANYVRSSAKMRATGQLKEMTRREFAEY